MSINRRTAIVAAACSYVGTSAHSQDTFPSKSLRWVIGTAAGGGSDIVARLVAAQMSQSLGQQIIVENKPGGGTTIAAEFVARSPADGYTVMTADVGTLVFNQALFKKLSYAPMKDLAPVGTLAEFPLLISVGGNSEFNDIRALLSAVKKSPGKYSYASAGVGSPHHLAVEMLKHNSQFFINHIPYRGGAPALQDAINGVVSMLVIDTATAAPFFKAGRLKALATFTKSRIPSMPEVPTLLELGYTKVEAAAWQGMVAPASTPPDVLSRLSTELQRALTAPAVNGRLRDLGLTPLPSTQAQMAELWAKDDRFWPPLIRERGISVD